MLFSRRSLLAAVLSMVVLQPATAADDGESPEQVKDYGIVKRPPTADELAINAVRYKEGSGYRCVIGDTKTNSTGGVMFRDHQKEGEVCTPATWLDWEWNCNNQWDENSPCDGGLILEGIEDIKFTGDEDCVLLSTALDIKSGQPMDDLIQYCHEENERLGADSHPPASGGGRRLDFFTACAGATREYLANWYFQGEASSFHFHVRNIQDNIKGWASCASTIPVGKADGSHQMFDCRRHCFGWELSRGGTKLLDSIVTSILQALLGSNSRRDGLEYVKL